MIWVDLGCEYPRRMNNQTSSGSALGMAVVTGASSGIGKVYAERLAKRGYDPILVARRTERLEALSRELQQRYSVEVEPLVADLGQETDIARVAHVLRAAERITMLVNNAGTSTLRPSLEMPIATVNNLTDVNAKSVEDAGPWAAFDAARIKMFEASQTGKAASRYNILK
jgi:short-subunit dehydrogenase